MNTSHGVVESDFFAGWQHPFGRWPKSDPAPGVREDGAVWRRDLFRPHLAATVFAAGGGCALSQQIEAHGLAIYQRI